MKKIVKEYSIIVLGLILVAVANEYFWIPNDTVSGGLIGISVVISNYVPGFSAEGFMMSVNILLLIIGLITVGKEFISKTVVGAIGLSSLMWIIKTFLHPVAVTSNLLLNAIFGSIFVGIGLALVFSQGASTGGTDIIAKILNKYFKINMGKCMQVVDGIVVVFGALAFGIEGAMYSIIIVFLIGTIIDKFLSGFNICKKITIMTDNHDMVAKYIMEDLNRGCTIIPAIGAYRGELINMIYCVVDNGEFIKLKSFLKENDPNAFIIAAESYEVLGQGFVQNN